MRRRAPYRGDMTIAPSPTPATLAAFGVAGTPVTRLDGGRGLTWRAGDVVLRPHDALDEARWKSHVLSRIEHTSSFCTARPVASATGGWVHDGWEAWTWLPGAAAEDRVVDVIAAGRAFHAAVAGLPRPAFLDESDSPWSIADRMAWEEVAHPGGPILSRLAREFRPVLGPAQLIHGDLLGNVLFSPARPPAIIDWAPYWRPVGLGDAIAAVDAVCWHGWPADRVFELGHDVPQWSQLLLRALFFRMAVLHLLDALDDDMAARHEPLTRVLLAALGDQSSD